MLLTLFDKTKENYTISKIFGFEILIYFCNTDDINCNSRQKSCSGEFEAGLGQSYDLGHLPCIDSLSLSGPGVLRGTTA